ncbi:MAG: CBS and ACT domain-containing protein [Desulfobacterota bacterium]|nr:CBS and ACT domain-containing protein [Thermodesulfobacteriota bacterium]
MRIREVMTHNPITVHPDTLVLQAQQLMNEKRIRRLPVVDSKGKLVGILTKYDLQEAIPPKGSFTNLYEMNQLLSKIKVKDLMKKHPVTVTPYTPVEDALRLGQEKKIGAFPVVEDGKLVGIATESDIVRFLIKLLGIGEEGTRITITGLGERFGELERIIAVANQHRVTILSMILVPRQSKGDWLVALRLDTKNPRAIIQSLKKEGFHVTWAVASVKEEW